MVVSRIEPRKGFASVMKALGDLAGAEAAFRRSIDDHPSYAEAYNNLGGVLWQEQKPAEATQAFALAVRVDPKFAKAHNNYGNALMNTGNLQAATKEFQSAVSLDPGFSTAHFSLGMALAQQGVRQEGEAEFRRALVLDPKMAAAHFELGLLLASGTTPLAPAARSEIEEGLRLDPQLRAALPMPISRALAAGSDSAH